MPSTSSAAGRDFVAAARRLRRGHLSDATDRPRGSPIRVDFFRRLLDQVRLDQGQASSASGFIPHPAFRFLGKSVAVLILDQHQTNVGAGLDLRDQPLASRGDRHYHGDMAQLPRMNSCRPARIPLRSPGTRLDGEGLIPAAPATPGCRSRTRWPGPPSPAGGGSPPRPCGPGPPLARWGSAGPGRGRSAAGTG